MAATKTIRSVERAVRVLKLLDTRSPMTLGQIAKAVDLPKSSVLRIVLTLHEGGLIRKGLADGLYRISAGLSFQALLDARAERLAEIGGSVLDSVRHRIGWPADLAIKKGRHMVAIESSRNQSPFRFGPVLARLGERIDIFASAAGRAYLAHCPREEYEEILQQAAGAPSAFTPLADSRREFDALLRRVRDRGYAIRAPGYQGQSGHTDEHFDDGLTAMAVPVGTRGVTHGSLIVFWSRPAATVEEMAARHLEEIQDSAAAIARGMENG